MWELTHGKAHCPTPTGETSPPRRVAYAFYLGTSASGYARSALVNARRIRELQTRPADIVVLHEARAINPNVRAELEALNVIMKEISDPVRVDGGASYYRSCYSKFEVFTLKEYDRVLFMDADVIVLRNLEPLIFETPRCGLAMPPAYWDVHPLFTSALMLVEPRSAEATFDVIKHSLNDGKEKDFNRKHSFLQLSAAAGVGYDMDILNRRAVTKDVMLLPPYALLIHGPEDAVVKQLTSPEEEPFVFHASGPKFWQSSRPSSQDGRKKYWDLWKATDLKYEKHTV